MHKPYHPACHPDMCRKDWSQEKLCPSDKYRGERGLPVGGGAPESLKLYPKGMGDELGLIAQSLSNQAVGLREVISELRALTESVRRTHGI